MPCSKILEVLNMKFHILQSKIRSNFLQFLSIIMGFKKTLISTE